MKKYQLVKIPDSDDGRGWPFGYAACCDTTSTVIDHINWLLTNEWASGEIGAYIMLSRLSELPKPMQLKGWDYVGSVELLALLERLATKDTKMGGRFSTTVSDLKTEAWETAMTIGSPQIEDWVDAAVMDETNPYVSHEVAAIVSSLKLNCLAAPPSGRIAAVDREVICAQLARFGLTALEALFGLSWLNAVRRCRNSTSGK